MSKSAKKRSPATAISSMAAAKPSQQTKEAAAGSKQSRVIAMAAEPLEADERLEPESEVDRQHDRVLAQDRRYFTQQHPDL